MDDIVIGILGWEEGHDDTLGQLEQIPGLECTDLPPVAAAIRRAVGLPVFDIVTLAYMVYESLAGDRWGK